jgi:hypothetical protein
VVNEMSLIYLLDKGGNEIARAYPRNIEYALRLVEMQNIRNPIWGIKYNGIVCWRRDRDGAARFMVRSIMVDNLRKHIEELPDIVARHESAIAEAETKIKQAKNHIKFAETKAAVSAVMLDNEAFEPYV